MALIMIDPCEDVLTADWSTNGMSFTTPARTGAKSIQVNPANHSVTYNLPAPVSGCIVGYAVNVGSNGAGGALNINSSGGPQLFVDFSAAGKVQLRSQFASGTVLATGINAWPAGTWNYIEVKVSAFHATTGTAVVKVNGGTEITFTGNTLPVAGTTTVSVSWGVGVSTGMNVDDIYLCDLTGSAPFNDFLGDCKVEQLLPNGVGAVNAWTPSTGANWAAVDESPPSATDYVGVTGTGLRDLYTLTDLVTTVGNVYAVRPVWTYAKSDTGVEPPFRGVLRGSDTTIKTQATMVGASTSYITRSGPVEIAQPNGTGWSVAAVNGLQIGQETL